MNLMIFLDFILTFFLAFRPPILIYEYNFILEKDVLSLENLEKKNLNDKEFFTEEKPHSKEMFKVYEK